MGKIKKYIWFLTVLFVFIANVSGQSVENTLGNKTLSSDSIKQEYQIEEVVVEQDKTTKITGIASGKISLNTEGVKNIPAMLGSVDLLRVLQLTPGVLTTVEGNSNVYVRGGDPGQTLLLYEGIPVYTPGHALSIFPLFNADHLTSLDLIKGGVSAQYGNFQAGAILTNTQQKVPRKLSLKGNVGLLYSQATFEVPITSKFGAYVSGRKTYLNVFLTPFLDATIHRKSTGKIEELGYDFYDSNITLVGDLSKRNKLTVNAFFGSDNLVLSEEDSGIKGSLIWSNYAVSAKLKTTLSNDKKLEQQLAFSSFDNRLKASIAEINLKTISSIQSLGYTNVFSYKIGNLPLESGIQYTYYDLVPQDMELINTNFGEPNANLGKNTAHNASVFITTKFNLLSKFQLEPGIRYNLFMSELHKSNSSKTFQYADFRFSGRYFFRERQSFRMTFSHNVQYVNKLFPSNSGLPTDFWIAASDKILPQYGNEASLGYYIALPNDMFEISSDIYFRTMRNSVEYNQNFIEYDKMAFTEKMLFGNGRAYGFEVMLKKNLGKLTGWLSYSLGRSERQFEQIENNRLFPAKHDRLHDFSLTASYKFNRKWDATFVQVYATGSAFTPATSFYIINNTPVGEYGKYNSARMHDYMRTDISVNYWFKENNGINLSVFNMFAVRNPLYVGLSLREVYNVNEIRVALKKRVLFTIMPSISWKFKF